MRTEDEILVKALGRGDREAQRELYDLHSSALLATALRYMGDRSSAEDVLHDAFIKIFSSIGKFKYRGPGSLKAWMSRIVVNTALQELRQRGRQRSSSLDDVTLAEGDSIAEFPASETLPREVLLQFIAELPDGYRTVFNLFCVEEYSHREIAEQLGINEKSSSSQLLRAKRLLATKIKRYIGTNE